MKTRGVTQRLGNDGIELAVTRGAMTRAAFKRAAEGQIRVRATQRRLVRSSLLFSGSMVWLEDQASFQASALKLATPHCILLRASCGQQFLRPPLPTTSSGGM